MKKGSGSFWGTARIAWTVKERMAYNKFRSDLQTDAERLVEYLRIVAQSDKGFDTAQRERYVRRVMDRIRNMPVMP